MNFITRILGIDALQTSIDSLQKQIVKQSAILEMNTKYVQSEMALIQRLRDDFKGSLPKNEKNDIEKDTLDDEIPVTDDMKISVVNGMKIRWEGESEESPITEINIE